MKMINWLFNFEKFVINKALLNQSLTKYLQLKANSVPGSNIGYSVTIRINLIHIRPNSLWQTNYHSYLERSMFKSLKPTIIYCSQLLWMWHRQYRYHKWFTQTSIFHLYFGEWSSFSSLINSYQMIMILACPIHVTVRLFSPHSSLPFHLVLT